VDRSATVPAVVAEPEGPGGPGGKHMRARCPICRKNEWAATPTQVVMPQAQSGDGGDGLAVQPFVCQTCGFVALMTVPDH